MFLALNRWNDAENPDPVLIAVDHIATVALAKGSGLAVVCLKDRNEITVQEAFDTIRVLLEGFVQVIGEATARH